MPASSRTVAVDSLDAFACALFRATGMDDEKADAVGRLLVLTDMMGRRTHGLAMSPLYLAEIRNGTMSVTGEPEIVKDTGATQVWDAAYLPGQWVVSRAVESAMARADTSGVATVAIRRSHHIGCLAALAKIAADRGFVAIIANSNPAAEFVAPFGGTEPLFTPNPFAIGYPGRDHPVLVDICASITTVSMTREKFAAGERFEHPWLLDADGAATDDPAVLENSRPPGSLQLLGGQEYGHKGFGLALMVEALSQGLSGEGRRNPPKRWGGSTYVQVLDPDFFDGRAAFCEEMDFLGDQCRANRPVRGDRPVRLPGDNAAQCIESAKAHGVAYDDVAWNALARCAEQLGVAMPPVIA
jgi:LDH2 family malate/lactate/ureidoglycolate dehydrogenase